MDAISEESSPELDAGIDVSTRKRSTPASARGIPCDTFENSDTADGVRLGKYLLTNSADVLGPSAIDAITRGGGRPSPSIGANDGLPVLAVAVCESNTMSLITPPVWQAASGSIRLSMLRCPLVRISGEAGRDPEGEDDDDEDEYDDEEETEAIRFRVCDSLANAHPREHFTCALCSRCLWTGSMPSSAVKSNIPRFDFDTMSPATSLAATVTGGNAWGSRDSAPNCPSAAFAIHSAGIGLPAANDAASKMFKWARPLLNFAS